MRLTPEERIYTDEVKTQARYAIRSFEDFSRALGKSDTESVFYHAHHFLVHAASIDKLLTPPTKGRLRSAILSKLAASSSLDLKPFRRLRNHLEHFDERIDSWISEFSGNAFLDLNIITGATGFPKTGFLRVMDGHTFRFYGAKTCLKPS